MRSTESSFCPLEIERTGSQICTAHFLCIPGSSLTPVKIWPDAVIRTLRLDQDAGLAGSSFHVVPD